MSAPLPDVLVIGAGAAGLLAATRAAERGLRTWLLEKNERPGVKILMSGGTRCNLTHHTDAKGIVRAYGEQGSFLHSALAKFGPADIVSLVEAEGVPTKVEPTGKIFPASNQAKDVLRALRSRLDRSGAELCLNEAVIAVARDESGAGFVVTTVQRRLTVAEVIVTAGGASYPKSGTSGDAYGWLRELGHTIHPVVPALVPLTLAESWPKGLSGLTLGDVAVRVEVRDTAAPRSPSSSVASDEPAKGSKGSKGKRPASAGSDRTSARGGFLFTHHGVSGPAVLDVSRTVTRAPSHAECTLWCDFLPACSATELEADLQSWASQHGAQRVASWLTERLPARLASELLREASVAEEQRAAALTRPQREAVVRALKQTPFRVTGTAGFAKAEVCAGGVSRDEIDSRTMQSRLVPGLYLAGEVLDLDGPIGGFNFQAAFSTGWLAGDSVGGPAR